MSRFLDSWRKAFTPDVRFRWHNAGLYFIEPCNKAGKAFINHVNGVRSEHGGKIIPPDHVEKYYDLALNLQLTVERTDPETN